MKNLLRVNEPQEKASVTSFCKEQSLKSVYLLEYDEVQSFTHFLYGFKENYPRVFCVFVFAVGRIYTYQHHNLNFLLKT